jgi:hypothetical protein
MQFFNRSVASATAGYVQRYMMVSLPRHNLTCIYTHIYAYVHVRTEWWYVLDLIRIHTYAYNHIYMHMDTYVHM